MKTAIKTKIYTAHAAKTKTIGAGEFKAKCLGLIDEVAAKRESVVITKNGKPKAKLVPLDEEDPLAVFRFPGIEIKGDIESPIHSDEEYEEFFQRSAGQLK